MQRVNGIVRNRRKDSYGTEVEGIPNIDLRVRDMNAGGRRGFGFDRKASREAEV